jgi:hypothetical protein
VLKIKASVAVGDKEISLLSFMERVGSEMVRERCWLLRGVVRDWPKALAPREGLAPVEGGSREEPLGPVTR